MKRALIGADPNETNIHLRLAKLYHELNEFAEAASYHQHVVDVGRAASASYSICNSMVSFVYCISRFVYPFLRSISALYRIF